jgi:hypothetical protein
MNVYGSLQFNTIIATHYTVKSVLSLMNMVIRALVIMPWKLRGQKWASPAVIGDDPQSKAHLTETVYRKHIY